MQSEQEQWAARLREIPVDFHVAVMASDASTLQHRPGPGEWSAMEVLGHMIDKMQHWAKRVERVVAEERPMLPAFDQDAAVREHAYQQANPATLLEQLTQVCERFAVIVERIPASALQRDGVHEEFGPMTLHQCIEAPLGSVPAHFEQFRTAQALV